MQNNQGLLNMGEVEILLKSQMLLAIRVLLGATFVLAAMFKALDIQDSRSDTNGLISAIRSQALRRLYIFEFGLGIMLFSGVWLGLSTTLAGVFLAASAVVFLRRLARGQAEPCNCFGAFQSASTGWLEITRNLVLGGAAFWSVTTYSARSEISLSRVSDHQFLNSAYGISLGLLAVVLILLASGIKELRARDAAIRPRSFPTTINI